MNVDAFTRARTIYRTIAIFAPVTMAGLARVLSKSPGAVESALAGLDGHGFIVSEDQYGRLRPWRTIC